MWTDIFILIGGLVLILLGASGLTDGAASVAKRFHISDLVIGLTIVAFGTSAPELVISVLSAIQGSAEMAIGNVVGSNIFNVLMIIGCLVAGGTSLPELATSVTAALKRNPGIAIGNVIGSNLFNIFFVLGCSASISPLPMGNINNIDMAVLIGSSVLFWLVGWFFKKRTITRIEGILMILCYIVYTIFLISQQ